MLHLIGILNWKDSTREIVWDYTNPVKGREKRKCSAFYTVA